MLVAKNPPAKAADETQAPSLGQEDPLEKEMATHSSILAWEIPRTEEPGRLQSMGLQSRTRLSTHTYKTPRGEHRQNTLTYITAGSSMTHLPEYWK